MCGDYQSYDEGQIDSGRTSGGRNPAFNLYLYIFILICIKKLPYLRHK